jgi:hypothetical protein
VDPLSRTALRPRLTPAARPDPETLILEAISRQDQLSVRQLSQALVHRHGVARLESFRQRDLSSLLGPGAAAWFDQVLLLAEAPGTVPAPPQMGREGAAAGPVDAEASPDRWPIDALERRVLSEVDAAIATMMATFSPEPAAPQPWASGLVEDPEGALERPRAYADRLGEAMGATGIGSSTIPVARVLVEPAATLPQPTSMESWADPNHSEPQLGQDQALPVQSGQSRAAAAARRGLEKLRRQWPRAAALMRSALNGGPSEILTAPDSSAASATSSSGQGDAPADWDAPAHGAAHQRLEPPGWEATPTLPTTASRTGAGLAGGASLPPLELAQSGASSSDAERLRRRLAQQPQSPMNQAAPAPRPRALAELGAWLPDGQLPRAS